MLRRGGNFDYIDEVIYYVWFGQQLPTGPRYNRVSYQVR